MARRERDPMNKQRSHLITEICVEQGMDPDSVLDRAVINQYITDTLNSEQGKRERALKVTETFTRGLITVAELHEAVKEIAEGC